jgi:hypothetical protein
MRRRGGGFVLAGLAATLAVGGCSFASVYGPPPAAQWPTEQTGPVAGLAHCTSSPVAPIIDGAASLGLLAGAGYLTAQQDFLGFNHVAAGILLLPGLVYLVASVYGFAHTSACRTYLAGPPY